MGVQAMNGPLQKRTLVLSSDFVSSNQLPDDYDTDLESPWSNPSEIICFSSIDHLQGRHDLL